MTTMRNLFRPIFILALFMLTMGLLSACGVLGGGLRTGDDINAPFREGDTGFVVCNELCSSHAQCGTTTIPSADGASEVNVVLVNPGNPATRNHGAFVQADQPVTIMETRVQKMIRDVNGESFQMNFYRVRYAPESGQQVEGWAHGMCVANRAQN